MNLQKLLLHYRITPHSITNKSPSDLLLGRKIRTKLDLITLSDNFNSDNYKFDVNKYNKCRTLSIGDKVQCRNYLSGEKRCTGKVIKKLGKLHYLIQLNDNRTWRRHINQILKIPSFDNTLNYDKQSSIPTTSSETFTSTPLTPGRLLAGSPMKRAKPPSVKQHTTRAKEVSEAPIQPSSSSSIPSTSNYCPTPTSIRAKPLPKQHTRSQVQRSTRGILPRKLFDYQL